MMKVLKNKKQLIIGQPYIDVCDGRAYLKANIKEDDKEYLLFFSVDLTYKDALCYELADCFLVAVMTHAMIEKMDIVSLAPISRHLLYSLKTWLIPQLDKHTKRYNHINIIAEPSDIIFDSYAVGTGWSGGVDCLYTFINNLNCKEKNHRLTHILNINAGVYEGDEETIKNDFTKMSKNAKKVADRFNLSFIDVDTNLHLIYNEVYLAVQSQRLCASILSLQKLFSIYYLSSAYELVSFSYDEENSPFFNSVLCSCFKTQNVMFVDFGTEITRIEKVNQIADSPIAQEYLHVCVKSFNDNCMYCGKCIRTIGALYALGKINNFSNVFDMNYINKNISSILGDILFHKNSKHYKEVLDLVKLRGIKIPLESYRYAKILKITENLAKKHKDVILKEYYG